MTDDLHRALDALVQDVASSTRDRTRAGSGLRVAEMTGRAHRNRVRRTVLTSALAACAVVGVVAGGVAATTLDRPAPVTPATTPSDSPTTTTTVPAPRSTPVTTLPAGDPSLPFGECGSVVGAATTLPAAPDAFTYATTTSTSPEATGGSVIEVRSRLQAGDPALAALESDAGPTLVLTRDGVVVAVVPTYPPAADGSTVHAVSAGENGIVSTEFVSHLAPTVCDAPGATAGAPLPAGEYEVRPVSEVWTTPWDGLHQELSDGVFTVGYFEPLVPLEHAVVVGAPAVVDLPDGAADPATLVPAAPAAPVVGSRNVQDEQFDPYPDACEGTVTPGDAGGLLPLTGPTAPVAAGTDVELTLTSQGYGRVMLTSQVVLRLVRDGQVVAVSGQTPVGPTDLDLGGTLSATVATAQWQPCGDAGPLAPGDYEVYPVALTGIHSVVAADGTQVAGRGSEVELHQLVGAPFTVTLG